MPVFTDQTGNSVNIPDAPQRIVSLVPSQTELLSDLGLEVSVAGITTFCVRPDSWHKTKTRVGGTKTVKQAAIHLLQPDVIFANKEENVKEQVEALMRHYPVWVSDVNTIPGALEMIAAIGAITHTVDKAAGIIQRIRENFSVFDRQYRMDGDGLRTAYLIWKDPYMAAGGDSFIHSMLQAAGCSNIFQHTLRYPLVTIEEIQSAGCELLLLSSEPYPFKNKHKEQLQQHLPHTKILLADGEMFSWYGSRMLHAPAYFAQLRQQMMW